MIGFYGSFKQGNRFNILLEYADIGSLDKYFKRVFPPTSGEDIIKFWESLFMLLEGLLKIHAPRDNSSLDQSQPLQGYISNDPSVMEYDTDFRRWHQDVKPGNILVSSQSKSVMCPYAYKFKLADLGISHFKAQASPNEDNTDRDSQGTRTYGMSSGSTFFDLAK
jgi:serine/threonine protein kinase